ncbi:MAG: DGQHR domain-containing protein [Chloroflexi bacterium]|nr:DGQHR domain-containing protein [Chloroflexota bacterium]
MHFLGKQNTDGSFSISVKARELVEHGWVDFYEEQSGLGYQRNETMREARAADIERYFSRCFQEDLKPRIFEMTASARCQTPGTEVGVEFEPLDDERQLGFVTVNASGQKWMSLVDGGTRLRGVERALASGVVPPETFFDVRLFGSLSVPEEIALFLLINENQKRVRTDLSLRVVQRSLDEGNLNDSQLRTLRTVVPNTEQWRYEASRVAARINSDSDSPFKDLIQMPGQKAAGKSIALQAMLTSLRHMLDDPVLAARLKGVAHDQSSTDFWVKVLKNFWSAVASVNPRSLEEPRTNVLWGSIGVNGCHRALAEIVRGEFSSAKVDLTQNRFEQMISDTWIVDYDIWYSRKGKRKPDEYPAEEGEATQMTGNSGYIRLAGILEEQWRAQLHASDAEKTVDL